MPTPDKVEELLLNLHQQGDREAAIVGASVVESALQERLIESFDSKAAGLERLFEDRGPLSDFNSKILIAQAFAVIPDRLADDMQRIRKIRNCFAHARIAVNFAEPLISKEVFELAAVLAVQKSMDDHPESYGGRRPYDNPKVSYGLSCFLTYTMLRSKEVAAHMKITTSERPTIHEA
jgi:hypothetical protein